MLRSKSLASAMLGLLLASALSACAPFTTIVSRSGTQPTPVVSYSSAPVAIPERAWKTYRADSGFEIRYPLDAYSIRSVSRPALAADKVLYPGATGVEPDDSFVYQNAGDMTYRITIAVTANDQTRSLAVQREQLLADQGSHCRQA